MYNAGYVAEQIVADVAKALTVFAYGNLLPHFIPLLELFKWARPTSIYRFSWCACVRAYVLENLWRLN